MCVMLCGVKKGRSWRGVECVSTCESDGSCKLNLFANIDTTHVYYNVLHGLSASEYSVLSSNGPFDERV